MPVSLVKSPVMPNVLVPMLRPGDLVDLEGDVYAGGLPGVEYELATVVDVEQETPGCVRVDFEGLDSVGFPTDHKLRVEGHDGYGREY